MSKKTKKHLTVEYEDEGSSSAVSPKKPKYVPKDWEKIFENIKEMRLAKDAPVDTMGCERVTNMEAPENIKRFQILVGLMLSSQTKDAVTYAASQKLHNFGFTPENLVKADQTVLENLLIPVGFYRNKAKFIKNTSQILIDQYNSDIPDTVEGLMKLPGVGPKMAHICMNSAWHQNTGIGVDIHVHRISNRLNWVSTPTKDPEKTRAELESWLPRDLWQEVNLMLVGFGQTICTPLRPKCGECLNQNLCPSAFKESPKKSQSPKKKESPIKKATTKKEKSKK